MSRSRVVKVDDHSPTTARFKWLKLQLIEWEDPTGTRRLWESAERTTRRGAIDGVAVVALISTPSGTGPPMLPVLRQFRPPVGSYCLELPAGLVDAGETAATAAVRELFEETGYVGSVESVTSTCCSDPGMSSANMQYAVVQVDGSAAENQDVRQRLEPGEFIDIDLVPWDGLLAHIKHEMQQRGCEVDARLLAYALGLEHGQQLAGAAATAATAATAAAAAEGATEATSGLQPGITARAVAAAGGRHSGGDSRSREPFGSPMLLSTVTGSFGSQGSASFASPEAAVAAAADGSKRRLQAAGGPRLRPVRSRLLLFCAGMASGIACSWLLRGGSSGGGRRAWVD